jgi:hypothetical protein
MLHITHNYQLAKMEPQWKSFAAQSRHLLACMLAQLLSSREVPKSLDA